MLSYEGFFLIILGSVLCPVIGVFIIIFYNQMEKQVHLLQIENRQIVLEKELKESEFRQLSQQIEPHFLFNALNSLLSLVRLKRIEQLLPAFEHLVHFLHYNARAKQQLVLLRQEIEHTRHYLSIQKLRFGESMQVRWDVDATLLDAVIPAYLLQTLVENAFKHGIEQTEDDPSLEIRISQQDTAICLTVIDNGPGFAYDPITEPAEGIGLKNVQRRLQLLYGTRAQIEIAPRADEIIGAKVMVTWPARWEGGTGDERSLT